MPAAKARDSRPKPPPAGAHATVAGKAGTAALTLGALGVVFGDIGTSPLYALQTVFTAHDHAVKPDEAGVYGVISLVFWAITIIVSVKYVTFIMRADNEGEGGIMALIARVLDLPLKGRAAKATLVALGIFGAALFYGDGMITPAISVLSAVEGLEVAAPSLESLVLPITLAVLSVLFAIQRFGTEAVGRLFGPVMALWFTILALSGLARVVDSPAILRALSPTYGIEFFVDHGAVAFLALGSVVLAVTGAEALYADMGHFGRPAIRRAWFFFVFPALTLNYMGQGSLILASPAAIENPFFLLMPHWARVPMVLLATLATVIASQAVISGAFSVTRQAVQLGFLPRLRIRHTSQAAGQIYVPAVNGLLYVAVLALVLGFGSSAGLASAYGIAVTGTLAIDTILFFVVVRMLWRKPLWLVLSGAAAFLVVDLAFFTANLPKVFDGGWFPLLLALVVFTLLTTWQRGRELVTGRREQAEGLLHDFIEEIRSMDPPVFRAKGTAICLTAGKETTPLALRANVDHNHVVHESVVIVTVNTRRVPHVARSERVVVDALGYEDDGILHVTVDYGFQDDHYLPQALRQAAALGLEVDVDIDNATYFVSKITIVRGPDSSMRPWRKKLFLALSRTSASPVELFGLPEQRIVTMGSYIEL
ncbi:MAG: system potassium uptake protein [Solirubrobacteraceae bacterium]|nr:system potassium uptake protein [Solirubrobacteraceae bacterium]